MVVEVLGRSLAKLNAANACVVLSPLDLLKLS